MTERKTWFLAEFSRPQVSSPQHQTRLIRPRGSRPVAAFSVIKLPVRKIAESWTSLTGRAVPSIVRRDPHAIAAACCAAPPPRVILGRVVKEGTASGVGASFYEREISVTEQIAR
jgi:hypothetical protein